MIVVRTFEEVRKASTGRVGLVPTMGYLHEGHLSLISHAAGDSDTTVVSLFVNPTQFGDAGDLDAYPTDEARDADLAASAGADILFAPPIDEVYPDGAAVTVRVAGVGDAMEGAFRPGHFDGVATVVTKLLGGIGPDIAFFGNKDAQQLALIRSLAVGLRIPTVIEGLPTVREADGLALSSRNARLSESQRQAAIGISRALFAAADIIEDGERSSSAIIEAAQSVLAEFPALDVEYVSVADSATAGIVDEVLDSCFVAIAAHVDDVRLIDNVVVDGVTLEVDRGIHLSSPSVLYGAHSR